MGTLSHITCGVVSTCRYVWVVLYVHVDCNVYVLPWFTATWEGPYHMSQVVLYLHVDSNVSHEWCCMYVYVTCGVACMYMPQVPTATTHCNTTCHKWCCMYVYVTSAYCNNTLQHHMSQVVLHVCICHKCLLQQHTATPHVTSGLVYRSLRNVATPNYRSLLQNIVCFTGLFCKRDLYF